MQSLTVSIAPRFCGPSRSGNGGYVCGLIAAPLKGAVSVRLFAPPPLETPLLLVADSDVSRLQQGDKIIGEGRGATLELTVPAMPSWTEVEAATQRFVGFHQHSFPHCFVCGPKRSPGDGLHIFAGRLAGAEMVASPWVVDASLGYQDGVPDAFIWAALDCPGAFAAVEDMAVNPVVLGQLTAQVNRSVAVGERCVVIAWPMGREGRKYFAGSALYGERGDLVAMAKAIWIAIDKADFE